MMRSARTVPNKLARASELHHVSFCPEPAGQYGRDLLDRCIRRYAVVDDRRAVVLGQGHCRSGLRRRRAAVIEARHSGVPRLHFSRLCDVLPARLAAARFGELTCVAHSARRRFGSPSISEWFQWLLRAPRFVPLGPLPRSRVSDPPAQDFPVGISAVGGFESRTAPQRVRDRVEAKRELRCSGCRDSIGYRENSAHIGQVPTRVWRERLPVDPARSKHVCHGGRENASPERLAI